NSVGLCGTRHRLYDDAQDPRVVFMPEDLEFFIRFEVRDRARRREAGLPVSARNVPSAETFRAYQVSQGRISGEAVGGMYDRYILEERWANQLRITQTAEWHGDPMAAIRRAILVIGSTRIQQLPITTVHQLQVLRDLYFRDDEMAIENFYGLKPEKLPGDSESIKEEEKEEEESVKGKRKPSPSSQNTGGDASHKRLSLDMQNKTRWMFGPESTTSDNVQKYIPILRGPGRV
ncbi:hypothetical protein BO70DRAFT_289705, partial [Aspergillus heteromorphus CBS 117.55]